MSNRLVTAVFTREGETLRAVRDLREEGYQIADVHTPWAVHGMEAAMGIRPSRLPIVCFVFGVLGALLLVVFQFWTSALNWPLNIGGKPFDSTPAFIPIAFEGAVLFAGIGVVVVLLVRCGLRPGRAPDLPAEGVTDDRFAVVVRLVPAAREPGELKVRLETAGAVEIHERIEKEE